jgi:hypothetical protein
MKGKILLAGDIYILYNEIELFVTPAKNSLSYSKAKLNV